MSKKVYTIIISPSTLEPARKFTLHRSTICLILFTLFVLVVFGVLGSQKYFGDNRLYRQLSGRYVQIKKERDELARVSAILPQIRKKESAIRKFLGLERNPDKNNTPGQGGRGLSPEKSKSLQAPQTIQWPPPTACQVWSNVRKFPLLREAALLDLNLQEIIDRLEEQKNAFATFPTICPVPTSDAWVTSGFGSRTSPFTGLREFHTGLDLSAPRGAPVIASEDGEVACVGYEGALGKIVRIRHASHYETLYGHLLHCAVKMKQKIKRGEVIGYVGNTGRSTGYHLHYEINKDKKPLDPCLYILNWKQVPLFASNE